MTFNDFFPDIAKSTDKNATKAKVLVYVLFFSLLMSCCLFVLSKIGFLPTSFPILGLIISFFVLLIGFRYTNSIPLISNAFVTIIAYFQIIWSLASGGIYSVDNFFLYILPLTAYVLSEVRSATFWLVTVNIWAYYLFSLADTPEQIQYYRGLTLDFPPIYYLIFCFTSSIFSFGLISIFYFENKNLIKKLEINQQALELKNKAFAEQTTQLEITQGRLKNSNQELEQYAYATSHDLKQPIRTINGFANLLKKDLEKKEVLDEENTQFLNLILKSSSNMLHLVTDLLAYAKLTAVTETAFQKLPLDEVLDNVLTDLQNQIDTNEVIIERSQLPTLEVVPIKINQIFQNIISNAIKFKKKTEPLTIKIHSTQKDKYWELAIEDNGIGIEPAHQEKIFAPFHKLHNQQEYAGSGIGLATCKRIIDLHKGKIWVESNKGQGATFIFTLPRNHLNWNL